jgi:transposase
MKRNMIGLDIAKSVFQVHREDGSGRVVEQRQLRRQQVEKYFAALEPSLIGIEACGTAHYWARVLQALGHEVRLLPAAYVKPFVRRNKTDARDAAAICAALKQADMRFVRIKSAEEQAARGLERARELLVKQRTQLLNATRSLLAEHGIIAAQGRQGFAELVALLAEGDPRVPPDLAAGLAALAAQIDRLDDATCGLEHRIVERVRTDPEMRRLTSIPGIGPILAHAIVAAIGDGRQFDTARDFAAWAGLTPRENSSAGKRRAGGISRQGDSRLRKLFALGASTVMRSARTHADRATPWQHGILARRPVKVAVIAQAAKTARIAWAVLTAGRPYQANRPTNPIGA